MGKEFIVLTFHNDDKSHVYREAIRKQNIRKVYIGLPEKVSIMMQEYSEKHNTIETRVLFYNSDLEASREFKRICAELNE